MHKYCRICWNTKFWREPTGEAAKIEVGSSYVQTNGFGHEEWFFNFAWQQPGPPGDTEKYRYASLQPIGKYYEKCEGETFNVFLYTITPDRKRLTIATIEDLFVPVCTEN
jgi:hypothetical protein